MKMTVVADESGEVVAAVVHAFDPSSKPNPEAPRVKPTPTQTVVTVDAPEELANRRPDPELMDVLRRDYTVRDGGLHRKQ
jgi:hypothetical protein